MDCDASDEEFDPSSIMDRVRGLFKYVCSSPQRRSQFEECVRSVELLEPLFVATVYLSKSKYPTLSTTLPTYMAMAKVTYDF